MIPEIYLAGPIQNDPYASRWRNGLKEDYRDEAEFVDPLEECSLGGVPDVVEADKGMIDEADGVFVCFKDIPTAGTPMEVLYTYQQEETPVMMWVADGTEKKDVGEWYKHHLDYISDDRYTTMNHLIVAAGENKQRKGMIGHP
jgi:nucleoside 2-deoxyribosyltransferase